MVDGQERVAHEIAHGRKLAEGDAEVTWGWGTPAGRLRARRRGELVTSAARLTPGMAVLEIGCGTGMFTETFAASGASIAAVDISVDLLEQAKARGLPPDRVRFLERRVEDLQLTDPAFDGWANRGFDAVVGSSVLHHLDLDVALAALKRLLKPGGTLALAEPNLLNPQVFLERKFRRFFPYISEDEWAVVRWRLRGRLLRSGFADVAIVPFDWLHPSTPPALIPTVKLLTRVLEAVPGVREFAGSVLIQCRRS